MFCVSLTACTASPADRKALETGFTQYSARQFDPAQSAADVYIQKFPNDPNVAEAYYLRGLVRLSRGAAADKPAAAQDFQNAIAKSNRNDLKAKASRALGDIAFDAAQWQQALDHYQQSLTFLPQPPPAPGAAVAGGAGAADAHILYRIGACLQALGQWDKAKPYFQRVAALNSDSEGGHEVGGLTQRSIIRMNATSFSLQFGAFHDAPRAADLIKQLKAANINATLATELREEKGAGQLLYLVRAGSYPTWNEAEAARSKLLPKHPLVTVVP